MRTPIECGRFIVMGLVSVAVALAWACGSALAGGNAGSGTRGGGGNGGVVRNGGVQLPVSGSGASVGNGGGMNVSNGNLNNNPNSRPETPLQPEDPAVVQARADLAAARSAAGKADDGLVAVGARLTKQFEASGDWVAAGEAQKAAQAAYDTAANAVKSALAGNPEYKAALAKKQAAVDALAKVREAGASPDQLREAAKASLEAGAVGTKLLTQAMAADPAATAAKAQLDAAAAKVRELKEHFRQSLTSQDDWVAAKKAREEAHAAVVAAEAKFTQVVAANQPVRQ